MTLAGARDSNAAERDDNRPHGGGAGGPYTKYRIRVPVGVAYGSDVDEVRAILSEVAAGNGKVVTSPAQRVRFRSLGASSLDLELLCWVEDPRMRGRAVDSLLDQIYKQFNHKGIEIPYTKQDLYVKEWPGRDPGPADLE